ncbi:facilitated trehalose transporter Tret1-2 homolog [Panulirus ornatus]|uniref:facilitated trehalose transporter Tret1-2 homolog n=1 Tax=Panulirus ornatus TaxID=150431 RepID=UPI003A8512C8
MKNSSAVTSDGEEGKNTVKKTVEVFTIDGNGGEIKKIDDQEKAALDQTELKSDRRMRLLRQGIKVFLISLGMWTTGSITAFPSVMAQDLLSHNTTFSGSSINFTSSQFDLVGSLTALGTLPGSWASSATMIVMGRRFGLTVSSLCAVVGWLGVALLSSPPGILTARFVSGVAVGGFSVNVNTYVSEVTDAQVRGYMSGLVSLGHVAGQLVTMVLGYAARYYVVAIANITIPLVLLLSTVWLPESPSFLVVRGHEDRARQVLRDLRGQHVDLGVEIQRYRDMNSSQKNMSSWLGLVQLQVLKSFGVLTLLIFFQNFSGYMFINSNISRIMEESGSIIEGSLCAIIMNIVQLFAVAAFLPLLDTIGRKKILVLSCITTMVPLATFTVYLRGTGVVAATAAAARTHPYGWLPLVCLASAQCGMVIGLHSVPFLLMTEYFPTWIRPQAVTICRCIGMIFLFLLLQLYTPLMEGLTMAGVYFFFTCVCLLGIPFTLLFVRETKGKDIG